MKKKVLITGITGFAGSHLAEALLEKGTYTVFGTYYSEESLHVLSHKKDSIRFNHVNLTNAEQTNELIEKEKPDFIYHLAAMTSPAQSFRNPLETIMSNIIMEINLLEAVKNKNLMDTKILVVSSADSYGVVEQKDLPIDEQTPLCPANPYAVSKITQDYLGLQYFIAYKMKIVRVRPFNHIGPRQSPQFVVSAFAKQIAEIEKGKKEPVLYVGNLETKRDFTDVRDMVVAYMMILENGELGEVYNIGTGVSYKISTILDKLLSLSSTQIDVKIDEALLRPGDSPELICDNRKIVLQTGWKTKYTIEKTLKDTLDYWRNIV